MLVLSRVPMEVLLIGEEIEVRVLRISRGEVRLGITTPRDVAILRGELLDRPVDQPSRNPKHKKSSARRRSSPVAGAVTAVEETTRRPMGAGGPAVSSGAIATDHASQSHSGRHLPDILDRRMMLSYCRTDVMAHSMPTWMRLMVHIYPSPFLRLPPWPRLRAPNHLPSPPALAAQWLMVNPPGFPQLPHKE
ncbi:carbon storage regulator [Lysobacter sp. CA199]|uniref:carbon storage regulator n=1 Tax=Lysobacter sp. CA199 TaxID=3455608 RepID=UPI003F8D71F5